MLSHSINDKNNNFSYSLLVGVFLSDISGDMCGNLIVWPGSHILIHRLFISMYSKKLP